MIAVLIDADNLPADMSNRILDWARAQGPLLAVRVFGDFGQNRNAGWCDVARRQGLELVFQPNGGTGKNSTDVVLAIEAMDLLQESVATGFCLASSDRDFVPLATRLRRAGRRVYVVGKALDNRMKLVCHGFLELAGTKPPSSVISSPTIEEPSIVATFRRIAEGRDYIALGEFGKALRRHTPQDVPAGKLRKTLKNSGWFEERGSGNSLTIDLKRNRA